MKSSVVRRALGVYILLQATASLGLLVGEARIRSCGISAVMVFGDWIEMGIPEGVS